MTKVYVMSTCPDCFEVKSRLTGNPDFEIIDIGEHVRNGWNCRRRSTG
ncbi:MAG: hypothetical protein ACI3ZC_00400 [Candidatus Cryptobacteroides sp.]